MTRALLMFLGMLAATAQAASPPGPHDFDFLAGEWQVRHRYLRATDTGTQWANAVGTCSHRLFTDSWANLEEHVIDAPGGSYRAVALRSYDVKSREWAIWWLDGRDPAGKIDPPMKGRFEKGVGTFYGELDVNGTRTSVRFIWSRITASSAQWEQAYSSDGGRTWETNWIMQFSRAPAAND